MIVAAAAPLTPQPKPITNNRSRAIFTSDATTIAYSGVRLSPSERRMQAQRLYAVTTGSPANRTRRYAMPIG